MGDFYLSQHAKAKCSESERGWSKDQSTSLLHHQYSDSKSKIGNETATVSVGQFDAIVLRVPHGWMSVADITQERIQEAISLASHYLGAKTVIISTLPLNNNVKTPADWEGVLRINKMIRDVALVWKPPIPGRLGVHWILVQEVGRFTNEVMWKNAQHIGYNTTTISNASWEQSGKEFLLDRVPLPIAWKPSIPMVCDKRPTADDAGNVDCIRNRISPDGTHWCMESIGPRYTASIACLLGCVYNRREEDALHNNSTALRRCEAECNEQFMSIKHVEERWIGDGMTLYSRAIT